MDDKIVKAALFVPVRQQWIDQAIEEFKGGKDRISFGTNSRLRQAIDTPLRFIYFKPKGTKEIRFRADFLGISTTNPPENDSRGVRPKSGTFTTRLTDYAASLPWR